MVSKMFEISKSNLTLKKTNTGYESLFKYIEMSSVYLTNIKLKF